MSILLRNLCLVVYDLACLFYSFVKYSDIKGYSSRSDFWYSSGSIAFHFFLIDSGKGDLLAGCLAFG